LPITERGTMATAKALALAAIIVLFIAIIHSWDFWEGLR